MECIKKRGRSLGVDRKPQGGQKFLSLIHAHAIWYRAAKFVIIAIANAWNLLIFDCAVALMHVLNCAF